MSLTFSNMLRKFDLQPNKTAFHSKDFNEYNHKVLFERLRIVSLMLLLTYPCFFYVDFFLFTDVPNQVYKYTLTAIHFTAMFISLLFILFYKFLKKRHSLIISRNFVYIFAFIYLFIGAISSINSQLLTGNINAYILILIAVASLFPLKPINMIFMVACNQLIFLIGLSWLVTDNYSLITKQINSTGTAVVAITIAYAFFTYRKNDFENKQSLIKSEENFRSLFNINPYPLILTTLVDNKILLINNQAIHFYNLQGTNLSELDLSFIFNDDDDKEKVVDRLLKERSIKNYVMPYYENSESPRWSMMNFELVSYSGTKCILIGAADVTSFKETEKELVQHASIDLLTGVMNRRKGLDILQNLIDGAEEFFVCFIDINNLKKVNDKYGHNVGDELIRTVCNIVNEKVDKADTLFRLGGDEFIVIFKNKVKEEIELIWTIIEKEFKSLNESNDLRLPVSASHGFFHYQPKTNITVEGILERADQEMYKDKLMFKNKKSKFNAMHLFS